MIGWKHSEINAYVDTRSVKRETDDTKDYGYGVFLFQRKFPVDIEINGSIYTVTSFARHYVVDCKSTLSAPLADFYFNLTTLPALTDPLITAIDYSEQDPDPIVMSKSNPIYKTLCPVYI